MKNKAILLIITLSVSLIGCNDFVPDIGAYQSAIVVDKDYNLFGNMNNKYVIRLKYKGSLMQVHVSEYDYQSYSLGDTIAVTPRRKIRR